MAYLQRLKREYPGERYEWFLEMFRDLKPEGIVSATRRPVSTAQIVYERSSSFDVKVYEAAKGASEVSDFMGFLSSSEPQIKAHRIIIHTTHAPYLDFSYIEAIGSFYDIDPFFFITHFERSRSYSDQQHSRYSTRAPSMLPLESKYLQFRYNRYAHATLMRLDSKTYSDDIRMFCFDSLLPLVEKDTRTSANHRFV